MMSFFMLVLFALPSLGITTTLSRISPGSENQSQAEELEERVPCSSQRRERIRRSPEESPYFAAHFAAVKSSIRIRISPRVIVGHRLANGNLAPLRC
ncbi:hypothetical protein [Stieleria tagensis]|uniref:hypothetical protein n=1 Tax=Stieleria tagensis TaxID=2956795 RepID=UPI00209B1884|nr:hypothetical protein [Stieleria tagensis]